MLPQEVSAGRNLITLFSSVNNLSRSFPSPCARRACTTRHSRRDNATRARVRRIDARCTNVAHASGGAAHSDSRECAHNATSIIATIANDIGTTCEGAARVVANQRRISRRTSAFARKLRELSAAFRLAARPPRRAMRRRAGRTRQGNDLARDASRRRQPARKNPRRFRRGFRATHGNAISALRFPAAPRTRPDPAVH